MPILATGRKSSNRTVASKQGSAVGRRESDLSGAPLHPHANRPQMPLHGPRSQGKCPFDAPQTRQVSQCRQSAPIANVEAYIDSLEFLVRQRPKGLLSEAYKVMGSGRKIWTEEVRDAQGIVRYVRYIFHQPSPELMKALDKYKGIVSRLDVAFDFFPHEKSTTEMASFIRRNATLRYRHECHPYRFEGTAYWCEHLKGKRPSGRNLIEYHNRPSKLRRDAIPVSHLELRFQNAKAVQNEGIFKPSDAVSIDPAKLFARYIRVIDFESHVRRVILDAPIEIKRRTRGFYERFYHLGQVFWDRFKPTAKNFSRLNDRFAIGRSLTWGARPGSIDHLTWQSVEPQQPFIEDIEELIARAATLSPILIMQQTNQPPTTGECTMGKGPRWPDSDDRAEAAIAHDAADEQRQRIPRIRFTDVDFEPKSNLPRSKQAKE